MVYVLATLTANGSELGGGERVQLILLLADPLSPDHGCLLANKEARPFSCCGAV